MPTTAQILTTMAGLIDEYGLHTGEQFAAHSYQAPLLDICAHAYLAAEGRVPAAFYTDEAASLALIEASTGAMDAIRAISTSLDPDPTDPTPPCTTNGRPDPIEHVSNWARTPAVFATQPPTASEVIGRILRAADTPTIHTSAA
ncbi:hypothetical protein [Streptomyces sp. NPDC008150]|uniref:DUF6197 family protein n=1 Tax=Streptomyces sp. NPDC008150 TaxID=3364816 RepID=UPI0036EF9E4C